MRFILPLERKIILTMTCSNKTALITGASRGIGKAIATTLAKEGYDLILVCKKNIDLLRKLKEDLEKNHSINIVCHQGDVSDSKFVEGIFSNLESLDVLVNNAGISYFGLLSEMTDDEWNTVMGCNLNSVFYFSREATKLMLRKHDGHIINISSVWGQCGSSYESAYSASKGGVDALTKALAKELAISGISVNAIACGMIDTDMNKHLDPAEIQDITNEIPIDRIGLPCEVGQMVLSIINAPKYMTGQIIRLDGGWK